MLSDKVCIVAGGGSGIGRATAIELGRNGANVVVNDLGTGVHGEGESKAPAEETARLVRDAGGEAMAHFGDIASLDYTKELVADTVDEYGNVDAAANFAAIFTDVSLTEMTGEQWDSVVRVHLRGHFSLLKNLAVHWEESPATNGERSFVSVSSMAALGRDGWANYDAAKAGILGLSRYAARELEPHDVRVNALIPVAYTRLVQELEEEQEEQVGDLFEGDEMRERMSPERVAAMVAFLMSDHATGITGRSIRAGGDFIGLVSDPEETRMAFKEGGWSADDISARFYNTIGQDFDAPSDE